MSTIQNEAPPALKLKITGDELLKLKKQVGDFNVKMNKPREPEKEQMGKDQFLKLLMLQLSKQDPLSPVKNEEFIAQMAQFSALEQMKNVSKSVGTLGDVMTRMQSQNLLGKEIQYTTESSSTPRIGTVSKLQFEQDGKTTLFVGAQAVNLSDVMSVSTPAETKIETKIETKYETRTEIPKEKTSEVKSAYGFIAPKF